MIDLLVAGGGPVGLAAAVHAALAGLETVVIEPRPGPVDKACGEGIMPGGVTSLRRLGVDPPGRELRGIRYVDGRRSAETAFRGAAGRGVRRTVLHSALAGRAAGLGVRTVVGTVREIRQGPGWVDAAGHRARWMIAADGLHSPVRRALGLGLPARGGTRRYGLRRHYAVAPWTDFVEVHWSGLGEAYVTPVADDLVGVAVLSPVRCDYATHLARFPRLAAALLGARPVTGVRGAGPMRQRVRGRVAGRVLLAGDAAGYVDALTGEGIALGLASAGAAVRCVTAGRPQDYETAWRRLSLRHRLMTGALVRAGGRAGTARLIVPAAAGLPALFGAVVHALQ
ncbi:FAD-dependent monooxygenase [Streptomyces sp. NPDC002055]|uniref:NAD(P)/FAD-dependent oxidoreductase n=1 Tax=Streptomyces sp. NPDC002055 TaxID=3154534 RepID=UPI00331D22B9